MSYPSRINRPRLEPAAGLAAKIEAYGPLTVPLPTPEDRSISGYIRMLGCHKLALLGGIVLGLAAALAFTSLQVPVYEARGTIEILGRNENFLYTKELDPTAAP